MPESNTEIRTLLASVSGGKLLLPSSVVAEIISYTASSRPKNAPDWLLGETGWNDWKVPVISFASLAGKCEFEEATAKTRVLVVKSLSESIVTPYLGILIRGVPRMIKVGAGSLTEPKRLSDYPSVFREVTIGEEQALIPDLDKLTLMVEQAVGED